jgi:hypothetical protein
MLRLISEVIIVKDFSLDDNGDIVIRNNDIQLISDKNLTIQKIRMILGTNKGEWLFNENEGINFGVMLVKNPNEDQILDTVLDGLRQVDETFNITAYSFKTIQRRLLLTFTATNENGEEISLTVGEFQGKNTTYIVCSSDAETVLKSGNAIEAISICHTDGILVDCTG